MKRYRRELLFLAVVIAWGGIGCSKKNGPVRYPLSGTVVLNGKPVAKGEISFSPEKSGIGGGFAPIRDGKFDTRDAGRGHLGGPHVVQIVGFLPPSNTENADAPVRPLFKPYSKTIDLPLKSTEMHFEVPFK